MGKKNKVVKLTDNMKLSPSSVKRIWMHWTKTKMHVNRNKSKRRKPWIRFERKHNLSMVHLDWQSRWKKGVRLRGP